MRIFELIRDINNFDCEIVFHNNLNSNRLTDFSSEDYDFVLKEKCFELADIKNINLYNGILYVNYIEDRKKLKENFSYDRITTWEQWNRICDQCSFYEGNHEIDYEDSYRYREAKIDIIGNKIIIRERMRG